MRNRLTLIALAAALTVPPAAGQDACAESEPCIWVVQIDQDGLHAPGGAIEGTVGDWHVFEFTNVDPDQEHTVTYSGTGASWTVPALSEGQRSDAFQLTEDGAQTLRDDVTGDTLDVTVTLDDVAQTGSDGEGTPGVSVLLLMVVLAGAAWQRRR